MHQLVCEYQGQMQNRVPRQRGGFLQQVRSALSLNTKGRDRRHLSSANQIVGLLGWLAIQTHNVKCCLVLMFQRREHGDMLTNEVSCHLSGV